MAPLGDPVKQSAHKITAADMQACHHLFAAPIPLIVLAAIAVLVGCELPADPTTAPVTAVTIGSPTAA
jgi:hypothetical protein